MGVSLFGLFLVAMLAVNPPKVQESFPWRKTVVGSIFGSICILGILAVLFPKDCSRAFHFKEEDRHDKKSSNPGQSRFVSQKASLSMRGHHPNCEGFSAHVFRVNNRTFCIGCTGFLFGALIILVGTILYFFLGWHVTHGSLPLVGVGILGIAFGLLQFPLFSFQLSFLRFFSNTFFILGTFLILTGIDALVQSLVIDSFLILLSILWLFTRIALSQWDHGRVCHACKLTTCELRVE